MLHHKPKQASTARISIATDLAVAGGLVFLGVFLRFICGDLPNIAPVAAIGLFAGFYLSRRTIAIAVPLAIMVISNCWFGGYHWLVMLSVYTCYMIMPLAGAMLKNLYRDQSQGLKSAITSRLAALGFALSGAILFFIVTNLAVWMSEPGQSIWHCYAIAIPFFRYTLCGDLFFAFAFFGSYDALLIFATKLRKLELAV